MGANLRCGLDAAKSQISGSILYHACCIDLLLDEISRFPLYLYYSFSECKVGDSAQTRLLLTTAGADVRPCAHTTYKPPSGAVAWQPFKEGDINMVRRQVPPPCIPVIV